MKRRYKVLAGTVAFVAVSVGAVGAYLSHEGECRTPETLASDTPRMHAIVYRCYGGPERMVLDDIAKPALTDDRVLIKVHAAAVNPLDYHFLRGEPYVMRMSSGVGAPKNTRLGVDFSGTVEAV